MLGGAADPGAVFAQDADENAPVAVAPAVPTGYAYGTGRLEQAGRYSLRQRGNALLYLGKGVVFSYGSGPTVSEWKSQAAQEQWLRRRVDNGGHVASADAAPRWYDPALRGWRRVPAPPECPAAARYMHTATATGDGKILVAGGLCDAPKTADDHAPHPPYAALSLWDPATHGWLPAPPLAQPRLFHSATATADGAVILIGGESDPALSDASRVPVLASVERFSDGKIGPLAPLAVARAKHAATALPGGALLVSGGFDASGRATASAELYDPGTNTWRPLPPMHAARHSHTATLLDDGRVLVAGGIGSDDRMLDASELWDPAQGAWTPGPVLPVALYGHAAAKLASGQVLVAGGGWLDNAGRAVPWAWTWNPQDPDWLLAALATPANESVMSSPVTLVPDADGSALVFTSASILRWVPSSGAGRAPRANDEFISGELAAEPKARPVQPLAAPAPQPPVPGRALDALDEYKWLLLALAGPLAGYVLVRRLRTRRL